ncbi:MAG: HesA/MoeB/ThiF family protein [Aeropyrum sp.]|nr:HesA/MoeB/ThiF family protein [Aeropyrum sp.]
MSGSIFDKLDLERFSRQIGLLGASGQLKLASSTVAVVGLGGLGSLAAAYLAAAGVGRLILVDGDKVETSNLHRQVLYRTDDVGKYKAVVAAERLQAINPGVDVEPVPEVLDVNLALEIVREADVLVDGLDNWKGRLALDAAAWSLGKTLVHGAAERLYGQVTTIRRGESSCLACLSPTNVDAAGCTTILGPTVGVVASLQVLETLKVLANLGEPLYNKLLIVDLGRTAIEILPVKPPSCDICLGRLRNADWIKQFYRGSQL